MEYISKYLMRKGIKIARVPKFWHQQSLIGSVLPELLIPFSVIYYLIFLLKQKLSKPEKLSVPVVCIGNITVGGAGKTPICLALAKELKNISQKKFSFVSRGYMGNLLGPVKVDSAKHKAYDVGDEPLLLARAADCWVGKNRVMTGKAAINDGAEFIILDDGFQNNSIRKDLAVLVVDGWFGVGNGMVMPSGPLREPMRKAVERADAVIFIGEDKNEIKKHFKKRKIFQAKVKIKKEFDLEEIKSSGKKLIAFSGISLPDKFFNTLKDAGLPLAEEIYFPDHHDFSNEDINDLLTLKKEMVAELLTTEKDAIRLPEKIRAEVHIVPVEIEFEDKEGLLLLIKQHI